MSDYFIVYIINLGFNLIEVRVFRLDNQGRTIVIERLLSQLLWSLFRAYVQQLKTASLPMVCQWSYRNSYLCSRKSVWAIHAIKLDLHCGSCSRWHKGRLEFPNSKLAWAHLDLLMVFNGFYEFKSIDVWPMSIQNQDNRPAPT